MANFNEIFEEIKKSVVTLAETTVRKYKTEAVKEAQALLKTIKPNLKRWADLLADGAITTVEFEWLVASYKEQAKMKALEKAGLGITRVHQFAMGVLNTAIDVVFQKVLVK